MSLSSLSGAPPPGARRSTQDTGGSGAPLSSLSGAPTLSGNKPKPALGDDDDDFSGLGPPTFSKPPKTSSIKSSAAQSAVRRSTPTPRMDDDDDFPKASMRNKSVHFRAKKPFGDSDDDDKPPSKSSAAKDPFGDSSKPGTSAGSRTAARSSSNKPSASNPAFQWDDDSPPRGATGAGKSTSGGKGIFGGDDDDFLSGMNPDSVFKKDEPASRSAAGGVRASGPGPSRPTGPKADDIFGMMRDEPPPPLPDLGMDIFGAAASKPAAGPRAGRRAATPTQQSTTDLSPSELSREPTPEMSRPAMSPEPSGIAGRMPPGIGGAMERSSSAPRGAYPAEEFGDMPTRSAGSTITMGRPRPSDTGPPIGEGSTPSPPGRGARPSGTGGGGMEIDGDDLPGLGSPALLSKNTSAISVHGAAGGTAAGRRSNPTPVTKPLKEEDDWEVDDNLLPDESNTPAPPPPPPPPPSAPKSPVPTSSSTTGASASTPSSGYTPSSMDPGRSRLQQASFGASKKEDEHKDDDEPSMGGYTPSFGPRRPSSGTGMFGGGGLGGGGLGGGGSVAASSEFGAGGGLGGGFGSALTPGGPGAPRPRRQMGASDTSPLASLSGAGAAAGAAAKPGAPTVKKTKEEEEKERVAQAMAAALARRQAAVMSSGPIRMPGQAPGPIPAPTPAPVAAAGGAGQGTDAGIVPTPTSPSPMRPGARSPIGGMGFGKRVSPALDSDSSDDDLPLPDKATSPPLPQMARKAAAGQPGHQPQRATSTAPLGREGYDSRVASSVPEMGAAASAAALGTVPGPGPGSIVQSSAPAPPLQKEVSYPQSVASQPSTSGALPAPNPERSGMSLLSQPSGLGGAGAATPPAPLSPQQQVPAPQLQQQAQSLPPGVTPLVRQPSLPPGVTVMQPTSPSAQPPLTQQPSMTRLNVQAQQQQGLPPGVTAMHPPPQQQQQGLPPGVTSLSPMTSAPPSVGVAAEHAGLPPGVTALGPQHSMPPQQQQQPGLPPGVTSLQPSPHQQNLPPGVTAMQPQQSQQQNLPPGVTSLQPHQPPPPPQQQALPPGVTAMQPQQHPGYLSGVTPLQQQQALPPGVTAMQPLPQQQHQQQGLPPGVTSMQQQGLSPGVTSMQQQGLSPGVTPMQQQGYPPGVTPMQQQQGLPPGVTPMQQQQLQGYPQGVTPMHQQGYPPGVTPMHQQNLPPGVTPMPPQQQQGMQPGYMQQQQPQGYGPGGPFSPQPYGPPQGLGRTTSQRFSPEPSSVNMGYSPDYKQGSPQQYANSPPPQQQQQQQFSRSPPNYQQQQQQQQSAVRQSQLSTAFAVPPDSHTAVAVSRAMPPQLQQAPRERESPTPPQQQQQPRQSGGGAPASLAIPGSAHSYGEPTLATQRIPIEALKESLVKSLQEELEKMSKHVAEVKSAYDKQLSEVRTDHERALHDTRAQHEKQLADVRGFAERQVEEARLTHRKQLDALHAGHERQLEEMRRRMERQAEEMRAVQEKQLAEARVQRDKVVEESRQQREKVVEDARSSQLKALEDARGQHLKALEDTRALHEKVLADTQAVHVKQVVELKNLYESELRRAAHDIGRAVDDTRRVAEEARRQEAEARRAKEEIAGLRDRVLGLEAEVRARDTTIRESETRLVQLDTRNKTELAETQANAIKEAALMKLEMEDAKAALGRVRQQYEETTTAHAQELARYRAEMEAQRAMAAEELQRARLATAEQVAAAEARGRRAGMLDKEIAEATIRQQMAAIAEEKEVVSRHRLSAELLAQLTEKVRAVAISSIEREERALSALERDVADREGRLAAREKLLGEREGRVAQREKEVDSLRADLQNLMVTLETSAMHDREDLKREQLRLTREAARVEAATSSLQAEREDLRVQIAMERRLLEEAREARRKEREELLTEVTTERRRLATEYADTQRALDAARTELLAVRSRLIDLESRCNGAITQAAEEEKRLEALRLEATQTRTALDAQTSQTRKALEAEVNQTREALRSEVVQARQAVQAEVAQTREALRAEVTQARQAVFAEVKQTREALAAEVASTREALAAEVVATRDEVAEEVAQAREELQTETSLTRDALQETKEAYMLEKANVDIEARELMEYAARLQAQSAELAAQAADAEARHKELTSGLEALEANRGDLQAAQKMLEEQRQAMEEQQAVLDGIKKSLDRERLGLAEERRALSEERLAASRTADEARSEQLKLADAVRAYVQQGVPIPFAVDGATGTFKPIPPPLPPALPSATPEKHQSGKRRAAARRPTGRSRNALKHMLDRLGVDAAVAVITSTPGPYGGGGGAAATSGTATALTAPGGVIVVAEGRRGGGPGAGGGSGSSYVRAQQEFLERMRLSAPASMPALSASAGPKLTSFPPGRDTSPVRFPPGLSPTLLPPGLAAAHARSVAITPIKHHTAFTLPPGAALAGADTTGLGGIGDAAPTTTPLVMDYPLDSERPSPARAFFANASDTPAPGAGPGAFGGELFGDLTTAGASEFTGVGMGRSSGGGDAAAGVVGAAATIGGTVPGVPGGSTLDATLLGSPPGATGGTGVIQKLLDTIQLALKKSSRVSASKGSEGSSADGGPTGGQRRANRVANAHRSQRQAGGGRESGGGEGMGPPSDFGALPGVQEDGEDDEDAQIGGRLSSEIASLVPLSSSSASLDLLEGPRGAESPDILGALGPRLDALAQELSSSTVGLGGGGPRNAAITPVNTANRFPFGASIGSEDAFAAAGGGGGAAMARQRQLGELAAMSEMLAARLEALGLGELGGVPGAEPSAGAGAGGGGVEPGTSATTPAGDSRYGFLAALSVAPLDAASVYSSSNFSPRVASGRAGDMGSGGGAGGGGSAAATIASRQASLRLSPSAVTAPSARSLWGPPGAGGAGVLSRSMTAATMGAVVGTVGGRSAADTPLIGSANAEALQGVTLPHLAEASAGGGLSVDEFESETAASAAMAAVAAEVAAAEHEAASRQASSLTSITGQRSMRDPVGTLSAIASVDSISDDDDNDDEVGDDDFGLDADDDDDAASLLP